jgi:hypothetical protein
MASHRSEAVSILESALERHEASSSALKSTGDHTQSSSFIASPPPSLSSSSMITSRSMVWRERQRRLSEQTQKDIEDEVSWSPPIVIINLSIHSCVCVCVCVGTEWI